MMATGLSFTMFLHILYPAEDWKTSRDREYLEIDIIPFHSSFSKKLQLQFSSLKTLKLISVYLSGCHDQDYLFSNFKNLEKLELINCSGGQNIFNINCPLLASLIITFCSSTCMFVISAPNLKIVRFSELFPVNLNIEKCPILEKAELFYMEAFLGVECISLILSLAKKLSNAKSLTVKMQFSGVRIGGLDVVH
ncbi:hypothetical protein QYF36_010728 [Acer negundo]|nr:hypothetical protein QYF36_010728 [Acer negundo]